MTATPLNSQEAIQKSEALKREWSGYRDLKIRAEADVERLTEEQKEGLKQIAERFGTEDLDQLRTKRAECEQTNSTALADFEAILVKVRDALNGIQSGSEQAQAMAAPAARPAAPRRFPAPGVPQNG